MSEIKSSLMFILIVLISWGCAPKKEIEPVKTITSPALQKKALQKEEKKDISKEQIIKKIQLHIEKREYKEAILELNKAIELDPQDASLYYTLGDLYEQLGQDKESVEAFVKALQLNKEEKISQKETKEIKTQEDNGIKEVKRLKIKDKKVKR